LEARLVDVRQQPADVTVLRAGTVCAPTHQHRQEERPDANANGRDVAGAEGGSSFMRLPGARLHHESDDKANQGADDVG
jgi:hypothetical protein